jgi:nucleotide-binding universal stress UspA family protein
MTAAIVVGIDGSVQSQQAMDWAFHEAERSGDPLHLLHVASDRTYSGHVDELFRDALVEDGQRVVAEAKARVPTSLEPRCLVEYVLGPPVEVLVHASETARMVVVGTHGRGAVSAAVLGSTGRHVARHAHSPVVVVHPGGAPGSRVVAGLDGDSPEPLLSTAFDQAASRGLPLTVVRVWTMPPIAGPGLAVPVKGFDLEDLERSEHSLTDDLVRAKSGGYPDVVVEALTVRGDPRRVLVDVSANSELLVVGAHGRGRFTGLMLGSTGSAVAAHARCPVMIAR